MKKQIFQPANLSVVIGLSAFTTETGIDEYHIIIRGTNPCLNAQTQFAEVEKAVRFLFHEVLPSSVSLICKRYFMSDPVNQILYIDSECDASISVVGQPSLDFTKVSLWCYCMEDVFPERKENERQVRHSGYTHHYYTSQKFSAAKNEYHQTSYILSNLKSCFERENMTFHENLLRTWTYINGIDIHFKNTVRAYKVFFEQEGVLSHTHSLISTWVEGKHPDPDALVFMDSYAIQGLSAGQIKYLHTKVYTSDLTLNNITSERGAVVQYGDRNHVFISGISEIDKEEHVVSLLNIQEQSHRALLNLEAVLKEAGCGIDDVVSLFIYLRDAADSSMIREYLESYLPDTPKLYLWAPVSQTECLIEIECMAISPASNTDFAVF